MQGINYNYGMLPTFHAANPEKPLISSESCSCTSDRGALNATDSLLGVSHAWPCLKDCWEPIASKSYIQGSFDWTGFDYRGEESPEEWPATNSYFGMLDLAGFAKSAAYYWKSQFTAEPVVHISPQSWEADQQDGKNKTKIVSVYTNAREVELLLNRKSLGKQVVPKYDKATFVVPFEKGELMAIGGGMKDVVITGGKAAAVQLGVDTKAQLTADGADVTLLTATVVDTEGHRLPQSKDMLHFKVTGPGILLGLGNGDPADHSAEGRNGPSARRAYGGLVRAIIQSTRAVGEIKVTVSGAGLTPATLTIQSTRPLASE